MFADENSKFDKKGRNFARWVENTMGKGEIAHYEQFLLLPQFFQKTCIADTYKPQGLFGKGLRKLPTVHSFGISTFKFFNEQHNFRLLQLESICRQQNECDSKFGSSFGMKRKQCGKRRKCCLPAFSLFPAILSKVLFVRVVKSQDCVVKS